MTGHQVSPLSQQIIAVSIVRLARRGRKRKKGSIPLPRSVRQGPVAAPAGFSGLRGAARSGQTCNFSRSLPAAYFFLCQLLAAASACGLLDLTRVACGPRRRPAPVLNVLPREIKKKKERKKDGKKAENKAGDQQCIGCVLCLR